MGPTGPVCLIKTVSIHHGPACTTLICIVSCQQNGACSHTGWRGSEIKSLLAIVFSEMESKLPIRMSQITRVAVSETKQHRKRLEWTVILPCITPFQDTSCYFMSHHVMSCHAPTPPCSVLYCTSLHWAAVHCNVHTGLHCTVHSAFQCSAHCNAMQCYAT